MEARIMKLQKEEEKA